MIFEIFSQEELDKKLPIVNQITVV
jgi:hypothetical protein